MSITSDRKPLSFANYYTWLTASHNAVIFWSIMSWRCLFSTFSASNSSKMSWRDLNSNGFVVLTLFHNLVVSLSKAWNTNKGILHLHRMNSIHRYNYMSWSKVPIIDIILITSCWYGSSKFQSCFAHESMNTQVKLRGKLKCSCSPAFFSLQYQVSSCPTKSLMI